VVLQILTNNGGSKPGTFRFYAHGEWINFNQTFPLDAMNRVTIQWNADDHTASATLNDEPLTFDSGGAPSSTLPFQNPAAEGATNIRFTAAGVSSASYFLDELKASSFPHP
jgi:hypothetical protein